MQTVTTIGLDIAKSVFQVHGVDGAGQVVIPAGTINTHEPGRPTLAMGRPIVVTVCMDSRSESWEPQLPPQPWHSRAGGGAVHSIKLRSPRARNREVRFALENRRGQPGPVALRGDPPQVSNDLEQLGCAVRAPFAKVMPSSAR